MRIDLNCDMGESFGKYEIGRDEEVIQGITSANIACGFHAGDPVVMEKTLTLAKTWGVKVGAHPGYPDLEGFGRRAMGLTEPEIKTAVQYQIGALWAMAMAKGLRIKHVKPHGALYNLACQDRSVARAIAEAVAEVDDQLILVGLPKSELLHEGRLKGLKVAREIFADRGYREDGSLVPRGLEGDLITEHKIVAERMLDVVSKGQITAVTGKKIPMEGDTICIHGDSPHALEFVRTLRKGLENHGVTITPMGDFVKEEAK